MTLLESPRDIPIVFSGPMVRALIREAEYPGTGKTNTRRLAWREPHVAAPDFASEQLEDFELRGWSVAKRGDMYYVSRPSPWQKVKPGDRLWVRENLVPTTSGFDYEADGVECLELVTATTAQTEFWDRHALKRDDPINAPTVPCIHMPRWASRMTLVVTATKIERLQEISEADARAEGVEPAISGVDKDGGPLRTYRTGFVYVWRDLHGPESWAANPEVCAISFRCIQKNIDAIAYDEARVDKVAG